MNLKNELQAFDVFSLLAAFLYGNLFVMSFSTLNWGMFLIGFIVVVVECINRILYQLFFENNQKFRTSFDPNFRIYWQNEKFPTKFSGLFSTNLKKKKFFKGAVVPALILNTIKRGFLLGFFIEAFKVGS